MTTITLKKPITVNGTEVTSIEVEEASVAGVEAFEAARAAGDPDFTATLKMLVVDLGWPIEAIRQMKASDLAKIQEVVAPLDEGAGPTGGSLSPT